MGGIARRLVVTIIRRPVAVRPGACVVDASWTMTGTHTGGGLGIPATGRAVRITGMTMSRVVEGRITEHWIYRDDIAMLRQLGLMPSPSAAPG